MFLFKVKCEESDSRLRNQLGKSPLKEDYIPFENISDSNDIMDDSPSSLPDEVYIKNEQSKSEEDNVFGKELVLLNNCQETDETSKGNLFKCSMCPKVYNRSSNLLRHEKFHLNDHNFKCELCDKKFTREDLLDRHKLAHAKKNNQELDRHISSDLKDCITKETTSDTDQFVNINSADTMTDETKDNRKDDKVGSENYSCGICKKTFIKSSRLNRHLKTHSTVKPFTCQICCKGFSRQELYKNHMNGHTGNKPHVCNICKKGKYYETLFQNMWIFLESENLKFSNYTECFHY